MRQPKQDQTRILDVPAQWMGCRPQRRKKLVVEEDDDYCTACCNFYAISTNGRMDVRLRSTSNLKDGKVSKDATVLREEPCSREFISGRGSGWTSFSVDEVTPYRHSPRLFLGGLYWYKGIKSTMVRLIKKWGNNNNSIATLFGLCLPEGERIQDAYHGTLIRATHPTR